MRESEELKPGICSWAPSHRTQPVLRHFSPFFKKCRYCRQIPQTGTEPTACLVAQHLWTSLLRLWLSAQSPLVPTEDLNLGSKMYECKLSFPLPPVERWVFIEQAGGTSAFLLGTIFSGGWIHIGWIYPWPSILLLTVTSTVPCCSGLEKPVWMWSCLLRWYPSAKWEHVAI